MAGGGSLMIVKRMIQHIVPIIVKMMNQTLVVTKAREGKKHCNTYQLKVRINEK